MAAKLHENLVISKRAKKLFITNNILFLYLCNFLENNYSNLFTDPYVFWKKDILTKFIRQNSDVESTILHLFIRK